MPKVLRTLEISKCIGCVTCMNICAMVNHQNHAMTKSSIHIKTAGGLSGRFIAIVCHACREAACAENCPTKALTPRKGGGVILNEELCIGCRRCVSSCTTGAVSFDEDINKPIICRHCGACAQFCPHQCLTMEEVVE